MDFLEYMTTFGQGYSSVDLGSSSSPPAELTNPEILSSLDFQKPLNGSPVVQSLNLLPPMRITYSGEASTSTSKSDMAVQSSILAVLLSNSTTDATIFESDTKDAPLRNMQVLSTGTIETVRRKPALMIQRVGRLSLQGFSSDGGSISSTNIAGSERSNFAFDSTDKILLETIITNPTLSVTQSNVTLPQVILEGHEPRIYDEAGVQTIIRLKSSSLTTCPQVVLDAPQKSQITSPDIETTTPVEIEPFSENEPIAVTAEVLPGAEGFILESTVAIFIEEDEPVTDEDVVEDPLNEDEEVVRDSDDQAQVAEFVEAQLLSDSASTTNTPIEVVPHTKPTAFATFAAITALVKMQRRIRKRYEQQRADLINSLGL